MGKARSKVFGMAVFFGFLNLCLVIYSAVAFSSNVDILNDAYWGLGRGYNDTIGMYYDDEFMSGDPIVEVHIGTRHLAVWDIAEKTEYSISWKKACDRSRTSEFATLVLWSLCERCRLSLNTLCVSIALLIILALLQIHWNLSRKSFAYDMPYIKVLGVISGIFFTTLSAIIFRFFRTSCYETMPNLIGPMRTHWLIGPGLKAILITVLCSVINIFVHCLTPVPEERCRASWILQDDQRELLLSDPRSELANRFSVGALPDYEYSALEFD